MYKCEILADSISPQGHRITTYKVTYPRIIHAEMCRHRTLSRNSASSRAIPFKKMVQMVEEDPFIPIAWQKDHKGMQGKEYIFNPEEIEQCEAEWMNTLSHSLEYAKRLNYHYSVTKQLCNRLLEPFMWHTELITGTEWENFFELRCPKYTFYHDYDGIQTKACSRSWKDVNYYYDDTRDWTLIQRLNVNESQAEIHMQALAEAMWGAMNESKPKELKAGEWHIPFGGNIDLEEWYNSNKRSNSPYYSELEPDEIDKYFIKIATARCARISYETLGDNPEIDYEKDIKLHDHLLESKHMSPFEHCARAMTQLEYRNFTKTTPFPDENGYTESEGWCNNFRGFIQYRYLVENK